MERRYRTALWFDQVVQSLSEKYRAVDNICHLQTLDRSQSLPSTPAQENKDWYKTQSCSAWSEFFKNPNHCMVWVVQSFRSMPTYNQKTYTLQNLIEDGREIFSSIMA